MSLIRARALRSIQTSLRPSTARASARSANAQLVAKRFASSGGHGEHKASSDLPWLLAGVAVTIPSCYYLWPSTSHAEHHGSGHGDAHGEKHEEKEEQEEAPAEEESSDAPADEEKQSEESADDGAKDESKGDDAGKDDGEGEGEGEADGKSDKKKDKGKVSSESEGADDTRKVESDSKGALKKRIDSGLAKNLGEGSSSKEPESSTSKKQSGLSNTDTKHSTQIDQDPEKSKKGEGAPETAKVKGAVDPSRPQK